MNYYINGNAAKADQIKAAFKAKGIDTASFGLNHDEFLYYSSNGLLYFEDFSSALLNIFKTHPSYKELELPIEPKFKVGDWIVRGEGFVYEPSLITEIRDYYVCELLNGERVTYTLNDVHKNFHLWTIEDAKDGDVIAFNDSPDVDLPLRWVGIYKQPRVVSNKEYWFHCIITPDSTFRGYDSWWVSNAHPATKEQRDLLFAKMREIDYEWGANKKELHEIIVPKFKVGDEIKTGNTIETIAEVDLVTRSYCCKSGRTIWFENQDLWHLTPKKHYAIANFQPFDKVLVRCGNDERWMIEFYCGYDTFVHTSPHRDYPFMGIGDSYSQCIPFDGNEHLLGTTDMPSEEFINW